jgi:ABC-type sugar transport system ATPase subunit
LLVPELIGEGNDIGKEGVMLQQVEQMVNNSNVDIDAGTRQRMQLAIKLMNDYIAFCKDPELKNVDNAVQLKAARKEQIEAGLKELMLGNLYVTEANRAIFKSILGFYSRDSYYASKELK